MRFVRLVIATFFLCTFAAPVAALVPASQERLRLATEQDVKARVQPILSQYCRDACAILDVQVQVDDALAETDDLGFEGVVEDEPTDLGKGIVAKVTLEIQVDERVTVVNRDRLLQILRNSLQGVGPSVDIVWRPVTIPQIGQGAAVEEQLKRGVVQRVTTAVDKVIATYCPEDCVLSSVEVDGRLVTPDEALGAADGEIVRDRNGNAILRLEAVDVDVAMDDGLGADVRNKIAGVIKARTRFVKPFNLDVEVTAFPESFASKRDKVRQQSEDPFGLGKLRETLRLFRELAGTKEVITNNNSKNESTESRSESSDRREAQQNASTSGAESTGAAEMVVYVAVLMVLGGLVLIAVLRLSQANRDARLMMQAIEPSRTSSRGGDPRDGVEAPAKADAPQGSTVAIEARREMAQRMKLEGLKDELVRTFLDQPRVAKETFTRLLQDEGVEQTAKYVHLFGHMVIFELLSDPNLQRDLFALSEYYNNAELDFTPDEELRLLQQLKSRVTANEIRVLTRKQMDKFDFLSRLDSTQVYNLIVEEKPQVQSIVLTQLDHKRRRAIFEMYQGQAKVDLMRELCRADAIPKEYLSNVAKALEKKVSSRPEFDTENLRSNDILLELMEKAELQVQRDLMRNLLETNPEAARGIKLKLVTVEIMPYLKDGHLLEIVLGLERQDLMTFLAGTRDHIRALLLSKAPEELADSWMEDLGNVKGFDEQVHRLVEMKILGRIRSLANNGVINLLDLNDMIFGRTEDDEAEGESRETVIEDVDAGNGMVA